MINIRVNNIRPDENGQWMILDWTILEWKILNEFCGRYWTRQKWTERNWTRVKMDTWDDIGRADYACYQFLHCTNFVIHDFVIFQFAKLCCFSWNKIQHAIAFSFCQISFLVSYRPPFPFELFKWHHDIPTILNKLFTKC